MEEELIGRIETFDGLLIESKRNINKNKRKEVSGR
jgi:hypothetical protein